MKIIFRGDDNLRVVDTLLNPESVLPIFQYGKRLSIELEFYHENGMPYTEAELNEYEKFKFGMDTDFDFITPAAALTIAGFTVSGNKISFILWTASARFKQLLGNHDTISAVAAFKSYLTDETLPSLAITFPVTFKNGILSDGSNQAPPEFQFSIDGETLWHDAQVDADLYCRFNVNDGSEWSSAIKMPVGPVGENGQDGLDGNDGADAPQVQFQFSVDGETDWHFPFVAGDYYQQISVDGGNTWTGTIKFVGIDGGGGLTVEQVTKIAMEQALIFG